jgi:reticulon-4
MDCDDDLRNGERCYLVGEEEAIWLLRLVLPYVNEVLLNLWSLFSGEPSTTMKVGTSTMKKGNCLDLSITGSVNSSTRPIHCTSG